MPILTKIVKSKVKTEEYRVLTEISAKLSLSYKDTGMLKRRLWDDSPFGWFKLDLESREKGAAAEQLVAEFLRQQGFTVSQSPDEEADLVVDGHRVEVKSSTLWKNGIYKFQQLRDQNYSILLCLGISPHEAHAWVTRKADIGWDEISGQHTGKDAKDTSWISFSPSQCPYTWLRPQNGDLGMVCEALRALYE